MFEQEQFDQVSEVFFIVICPEASGLPGRSDSKESACNVALGQKIPWRREWLLTPACLPGESHGQRSLAGYSPGGRKESDMTE